MPDAVQLPPIPPTPSKNDMYRLCINQLDGSVCLMCAAEETLELANQILESKQKAPLMPQVLDAETPEV